MPEGITTELRQEGEKAFPESKENDNSSESSTEQTDISETQPDEGSNSDENKDHDAGLANHPRWKERENDWKNRFNEQEKRHLQEITSLRTELEAKLQGLSPKQINQTELPKEIPSWFNGDERQWKEFNNWFEGMKEDAKKSALGEMESKTQAEQKAVNEANEYFKGEIKAIEEDTELNPQGLKVDQNKLLKIVLDNDLVDSKGRWNYRAGWRLMNANSGDKGKTSEDRKKLAGSTISDKHAEGKPKSFMTSSDFQKPGARPW